LILAVTELILFDPFFYLSKRTKHMKTVEMFFTLFDLSFI